MPPDKKMMYDAIDIADAKMEITSDGYLKAMPRCRATSGRTTSRSSRMRAAVHPSA